MKVVFDFDLYGTPDMDSHLVDIMLALKREIIRILNPYKLEIEADDGMIEVTLIPGIFTMRYHSQNEQLWTKVQELLNNMDWESVIRKYAQSDFN